EFQERATRFKSAIALPVLETSPAEIQATVSNTLTKANLMLGEIASCGHDRLIFANTIGALDDLVYQVGTAANRMQLLKETSTNAAVRDAATDAAKTISEWSV